MNAHAVGRFVESTMESSTAELSKRYDEDGYLFFRDALDAREVGRVREDLMRILADQGAIVRGAPEPEWTGMALEDIDDEPLYASSYQELCESPTTAKVLEHVFGEPVYVYRGTPIRYTTPSAETFTTLPHQDNFLVGPNSDFRTFWIPLIDIPEIVGGLAVARASHKTGLRRHVEEPEYESYFFKGRPQKGIPLNSVPEEWLTTDYRPSDVLIFHSQTVHRALPNRSHVVRISIDGRAQPAGSPRSFQLTLRAHEQRDHLRRTEGLASTEGASREEFEAIAVHMLRNGVEPEPLTVRRLLGELRAGGLVTT